MLSYQINGIVLRFLKKKVRVAFRFCEAKAYTIYFNSFVDNIPEEVVTNTRETFQAAPAKIDKEMEKPCLKGKSKLQKTNKYNCNCNKREIQLRVQKVLEGIKQQQELHKKRMETAEAENRIAILKLLAAEKQLQDWEK